jgi:hypothetical protein
MLLYKEKEEIIYNNDKNLDFLVFKNKTNEGE